MIRLVAAGCGRVFERFHLTAIRGLPQWSLVGAADPSSDRLAWVASRVPGIVTEATLGPLLSRLQPDAVLISSPPKTHCALAIQALAAGAHVLIEKPMVLQVAEADQLLESARARNRQVWVGFNRRFRPGYAALRARLAHGDESRITNLHFELCSDPLGWGAVSSPEAGIDRAARLLEDIGSHQLDLVPWLLGQQAQRVRARVTQADAQDIRILIDLQFAGGSVASCLAGHTSRYVERLEVGIGREVWLAGPGGVIRQRLLPKAGAQQWLQAKAQVRALAHKLMGRPSDTLATFQAQLASWAAALEGRPAEPAAGADGAAGLSAVALVEASRRSMARHGAWVELTTSHTN